ncbi:S-layer homology domain-containing protein [Paenibacillus sp. P36]|uniref:S-layer homology domain-containing protein n=1 Tax=Paenibacillus sp. P36 TaxID=3342538 RepID=UPI0038B3FB75
MSYWKHILQKIGLSLIVVFIIQIILPTVSFAFSGFFMYSPEDGRLRGYVYVKDPTKVSVDITNNGSVTTITYDHNKDKLSFHDSTYYGYDNANVKLKNVNFNSIEYTANTAPSRIVASDGQSTQEFTKEIDSYGNVRYFGDNTKLGLYRILGKPYLSKVNANTYIPRNNQLVGFIPASDDSNAIQLSLPSVNNLPAIDFGHLALSDFVLKDVTAGSNMTLTGLNRLTGYETLQQYPNSYFNSVITLETSTSLVKDHIYELSLSSLSNSDEIKLPAPGTYSFSLITGIVKVEFVNQGKAYYEFEGHSAAYFDNIQLKGTPQLKISPETLSVGQEKDFKVFNQFDDGTIEDVTDYEITSLTFSDVNNKAISLDSTTKKIKALNPGSASLIIKHNGENRPYFITVIAVSPGGSGGSGFFQYFMEDQDLTRGQIHPKVSWMTSSEALYSGYELTFSDTNGSAIGQTINVPKQVTTGGGFNYLDIPNSSLPLGAVYVDLTPKDLAGHKVSEMYRMQIFDNTSNSPVLTGGNPAIPAPVAQAMQFDDQDTRLWSLGGHITWYDASTSPSPATSYSLYFVDANNTKLKPIAEIQRNNFKRPYQNLDLPSYEITLPNGFVMPEGAQKIGIFGKNAQGESTQGYYYRFWDKIAGTMGNDYFEDTDNRANHINGTLNWTPMLNETTIVGYVVQFLGKDFEPIGNSFAQIGKGQQQYSVSIREDQIPVEAKVIALRAVNADGIYLPVGNYSISDNILGEATSSSPVDQQLPGITQIMNWDLDGELGEIGGYIYFNADYSAVNSSILRYDIYFVNDQLQKIKPIISLSKNNVALYQTSIPMNTKIPNGATKLAVYGITATGESVPKTIDLNDRIYSPPLLPSQISITNNKSDFADTITITGLQAYDAVSIYRDVNSSNAFLVGSVEGNASSISFSVPQLGKEEGSLYFALQRNGGIRSLKVLKSYDKEPTIGGAVGGGGGGGGPVGPAELFKWDIVNQNGAIRVSSSISPEQLKKLVEEQAKASKNEILIDLKTTADGYDFKLNAGLIDEIKSKLEDPVLVFNTTIGTARIPFDVLQDALEANGGKDWMSLRVSIEKLSTADQQDLEKMIALNGGESVGKALSYELSLINDSNSTVATIDSFSEYVGHHVLLPKDFKLNPGEKLNGAVWDPQSKTLISVPLTITWDKDDKPAYATLWRKGNSIYTVFKSQKQFADVKEDYFAKDDIESLAASNVIQGFEDGSFRADENVTRAEFATLLVRGLGLKPVSSTYKGFSDVNEADWYSQAVYTAVSSDLISGYEDGTFRPTQNITHQEAVTMISNALKFINKAIKLDDSERARYAQRLSELSWPVDEWAIDAAAMAMKRNVLNAGNGFSFEKDAKTTRGQTALLINKLLQNAAWPKN